MPANKSALLRYKTIDQCLQNRHRKWTLDDLIEKVSDALYEYEGMHSGVSRRTIQADIQLMRSDKLGYNAPIIVVDKKYYAYEDKNYSITHVPITESDMANLSSAIDFLSQFKGFSHFEELTGVIQKLEDHVHKAKAKTQPVIEYETNVNLKGLEHLDKIYQAIINKKALNIAYKSFKAKEEKSFIFHALLLKEFNNRWFVFGTMNGGTEILNLALDRIITLEASNKIAYRPNKNFNSKEYFKDNIGVTALVGQRPDKVVFKVDHSNAPYIETKPIHESQQCILREDDGITFQLYIKINFELERLLLGFGNTLTVIKPNRLKNRIKDIHRKAFENYFEEKI
jgi:predicted DNA-binding transcriptional regulator YafY